MHVYPVISVYEILSGSSSKKKGPRSNEFSTKQRNIK